MIQLSPHMRVFVYVTPVDFRSGIDGLAGVCRSKLGQNPMSGAVFLFINRHRAAMKLLTFDGQGFVMCHKRLSQGKFKFWPQSTYALTGPQVLVLLYNGDPCGSKMAPAWKPLPVPI
ncbi:MAG: IS66 family insertion sequence element accessory protein TnpB [Candidatus Riflebacteria bacterium]|nr:IS66 family insertion sequence element accessory protein TnpB [Candidatus Riflebacteria bacterium]